jgi:RNA polymerase sigma-70 factor (ECF subfamily)
VADRRRWSREFLSAWDGRAKASFGEPELESRLAQLLESGRLAFPDLALSPESFVRHLALRLAAAADPVRAMAEVRGDDLYLACACAEGVPGAVAALEGLHFAALGRAVARINGAPEFADEVKQELRERLFLRRGEEPPGIASFAGAGSLAGWLRISAQRAALNLQRRRPGRPLEREEQLIDSRAGHDPEMELLKARFRPEFDRALRESLTTLEPRERLILRLHYVDGLSTRQIGKLQGKNQSTVSRAVAAARARLRDATLRSLRERLKLSDSQVESIAGLVVSRLELSLGGVLDA